LKTYIKHTKIKHPLLYLFKQRDRLSSNKICSRHNIAEILLMLALNTNQSINQSNRYKTLIVILISHRF
jgi:hypothetical protein